MLLHQMHQIKRHYQVPVVGGAGALLSDAHAEARQAAVLVFGAEMEGTGLTVGARWAFNVHLQHSNTEMTYKAINPLL